MNGHDHAIPVLVASTTDLPPGPHWRWLDRKPKHGNDRLHAFELIEPLIAFKDVPVIPDDKHLDDVLAVVAELVSNAIRVTISEYEDERPPPDVLPAVGLGIHVTDKYTHILVRDAVPEAPQSRDLDELLAEIEDDVVPIEVADAPGSDLDCHGFGLVIVDALCADWWTVMRAHDKTVHAIVARPGVTLNAGELKAIRSC